MFFIISLLRILLASVIVIFSVVVCDNPEVVSYKLKFHLRNLKAILPLTLGRYLAHRMFIIKIIGCKKYVTT